MKRFPSILCLLATFVMPTLLSGCAQNIPPEVVANADYGSPPPENYKDIIKQTIGQMLIDPTAPLYEFSTPTKGYTKGSPVFGTQQAFGWRVCGTVNSKNRFGGYVGRAPFFVLFRNGVVVSLVTGEGTSDSSFVNVSIGTACTR